MSSGASFAILREARARLISPSLARGSSNAEETKAEAPLSASPTTGASQSYQRVYPGWCTLRMADLLSSLGVKLINLEELNVISWTKRRDRRWRGLHDA